ncbi:WXG100 family type VII secretion target [Actinospica sp.]|uniref:WXG100 family type VII secretion target n=1 Tax=Actinospica sp. TaxID=1872142 RepID=UPI002B9B2922|nr:WXG100 family type VII secretion target [Actinospica sp.]HWG25164.1 WXG100 family type VII secretion target [Actinospica sp.]
MTDYGSMSHQQLYDFVQSGSAGDVESAATLNANHAKSVTEATDDLQKTLTNIQSSWSGAAADQFSQQAMALVQQMQQHAQTADNTHTWMNYAGQSLGWAQQNIPSPPSQAEQDLAAINSNPVSEWGLGVLTDGASYLASKAATDDITKKKAAATSVMTQLASAYSTANSHLTASHDPIDGGSDGNNGSGTDPNGNKTGNGSSSNGSGGGGSGAAMIMPMPMAMPMSNSGSGSEGASARISTGSYGTGSSSSGSGSGISGSGVTDTHLPTSTVTSGMGDLPTSGVPNTTPNSVTNFGSGNTGGSGYTGGGIPGMGSPGGVSEFGGGGGGGGTAGLTEGEGGVGGSSRFGSGKLGGLGGGSLSEKGAGGFGSTGLGGGGGAGGYGGSGAGRNSALSGGTGTGELGQEAGGTGTGTQTGSGTDSAAGTSAAAAAGEAEGANSSQNNMMGGGMGGMGRGGGGGGGQGERGGRASWLKEDPDYWYGDKMKDAAPPGGVIE